MSGTARRQPSFLNPLTLVQGEGGGITTVNKAGTEDSPSPRGTDYKEG